MHLAFAGCGDGCTLPEAGAARHIRRASLASADAFERSGGFWREDEASRRLGELPARWWREPWRVGVLTASASSFLPLWHSFSST